MTPINLQPFCADADEPRAWMRSTVACDGWTVATNGAALIAVPAGVECAPVANVDRVATLAGIMRRAIASAADETAARVCAADLVPELAECLRCAGAGVLRERNCDDCDGRGEFVHGINSYDCKSCHGHGTIELRVYSDDASAQTCSSCRGTGRSPRCHSPLIGDDAHSVAGCYIALFARHLPDAEITTTPQSNAFYVRSVSTGIVGAISALRLPTGVTA